MKELDERTKEKVDDDEEEGTGYDTGAMTMNPMMLANVAFNDPQAQMYQQQMYQQAMMNGGMGMQQPGMMGQQQQQYYRG